jgi:hypothetical protein
MEEKNMGARCFLASVLQLPQPLLHEFFAKVGCSLATLYWCAAGSGSAEAVTAALSALPRVMQVEIESALALVNELACPMGWQAILEAARRTGKADWIRQWQCDSSEFERSIKAWILDDELFQQAIAIHRVTGLSRERRRPMIKSRQRKRAKRTATIELLTRQLKEHIVAAQDYARVTAERNGVSKLLPRPTQRDLARLVGASEAGVSRCLHDPAARELRLLWEIAGDLDRLLALPASRNW